jgi:hypothetical protein
MLRMIQLAAAALMLSTAASAHAQLHLKHDKPQVEDLSWMWQYTAPAPAGNESALLRDAHFKALLVQHLTAPQTFWSKGKSLADTALEYLGQPRSVVADENRYITATGCVQEFCPNRGLLWIDLGSPRPLIVFAATNWIAENKATDQPGANYTLWVFSNRAIDPARLPRSLTGRIAPWAVEPLADGTIEQIANVILVDPDGQPHPLQPSDIGIDQPKPQTEQKAHS